jgi:hypothetical protein
VKFFGIISIALSVLSGNYSSAFAADIPARRHFSASPYFWAAGINGTAGQSGLPLIKMKSDFDSMLKNVDFSFRGVAEARYNRYSLFHDVTYTDISAGAAMPYEGLSNNVDVKSQTFSGLFGGGYSVLEDGKESP